MKKIVSALMLAGMVSAPAVVMAAETSPHTVTGNVGFASDYRFRGISQTYEDPAIQGGFDYAHSSGFYLGTWGSNVESLSLNGANMEWDVYGGYTFSVGDVAVNVGGLYYWYPSQTNNAVDIDTFELYAGATWKWLNVKYSHSTTELFGIVDSENSGYLEANVNVPLPADVTLGLHYGYQGVAGSISGVDNDSYSDWKISVSKPILGFNVSLAYVDTDVESSNVTWGYNTAVTKGTDVEDLADGTVVLTVGKTF